MLDARVSGPRVGYSYIFYFGIVAFSSSGFNKLFYHTRSLQWDTYVSDCGLDGNTIYGVGKVFALFRGATVKPNQPKRKLKNMKLKYLALIMIGLAGLGLQQAKADVFTSDLNAGNSAISSFTGPYGLVTIDLTTTTTATVTFTSNTVGTNIYLFGDGGSVALNVHATTFTATSISGSNSGTGFTPGAYTVAKAGNEDGLGTFNLRINSDDGYTHSSDTITFTLTNTSGTWASASDVLINNANGFDAAAHIFVAAFPADASASALATGFAGEGPQSPPHLPDGGATVMLLGAALGVLGVLRRRLMS